MLTINIPPTELWDETKNEFIEFPGKKLQLEHSLVSLSKWESIWKKPFITPTSQPKTREETLSYVRCMTITQNVDPYVYRFLTNDNLEAIRQYIDDPMTATTFQSPGNSSKEIVTSEVIYYWMITFGIPMECQKWHLNRLLTLVRVCSIKNQPAKKMSNRQILSNNAKLNAARRAALHTKG